LATLTRVRRALIGVAAAVLLWASAAAAGDFTKTDGAVTMSDGVQIATTFFEPAGTPPAGGWPAVVIFHGLGQTRNSTELGNVSWNDVAATYLAPEGYAVLTFDARAHGQSGGLFTLDGPRELQDTKELFAWLTAHPEIDAKRVGAFGVSYGGGMIWLSALAGVPWAAIAPAATWTDLREALAPGGVGRSGVILGFSNDLDRSKIPPDLQTLLADSLAGRNIAAIRAFLADRSPRAQLSQIGIPTLVLQGRRDFAFDADQALAAFRALRGPKRLYLGDFGHTPAANPPAEYPYFATEVRTWFDRFVKGIQNGIDRKPPVELAHDPWSGRTTSFAALPPTRTLTFSWSSRSTLSAAGKVVRTTAPVGHVETFGGATVTVPVSSTTGYPHLVVVLSALEPGRGEVVIAEGAAETSAVRSQTGVTVRLQNEISSIPARSRLRLTIGSTSTVQNPANLVYFNQAPTGALAGLGKVTLKVPVLVKPVSP
jgi:predicted acyl esterase